MRYLAVLTLFFSLGYGQTVGSGDGKKVLVVFGDSLSAGYGLAPEIGRAHV